MLMAFRAADPKSAIAGPAASAPLLREKEGPKLAGSFLRGLVWALLR
jgi:hypothetical protein